MYWSEVLKLCKTNNNNKKLLSMLILFSQTVCRCHHIIRHIYYVTIYDFLKLWVSPHRPARGLLCPRRASGHEASFSHPLSQSSAKRPTTLVIGGSVSKTIGTLFGGVGWETAWHRDVFLWAGIPSLWCRDCNVECCFLRVRWWWCCGDPAGITSLICI